MVKKPAESYFLTRWIFFRLLGLVHLTAFGSYAYQILGLNGSLGILPTKVLLERASTSDLALLRFWLLPTITWFNCSDAFLQGITYAGVALSLFVILGIATGPMLVLLSILWLSLVTGGGEFTGFQSDGMLVEATVLSLFFVSWQLFEPPWPVPLKLKQQSAPSKMSLLLLKFMIFRLMFASGLVKIRSGDPTWRDLTALQYHFETQPIPTPLAWYAHHLPVWMLKLSVVGTYLSELIAPPFVFAPQPFRLVAAALMALMHLLIALTGNYTFLNFLTIVLCVPLVDDSCWRLILPKQLRLSIEQVQIERKPGRAASIFVNTTGSALLLNAGCMFAMSIFDSASLPQLLRQEIVLLSPFHISDSYGLFAVMTTKRPEIVFEGSNDGKTWYPYEFKYKPGDDLKRPPPWVEPHMPRLDWRLWFAAMEPLDANPWVLALVERMLQNSPAIKIFFEPGPFSQSAPKYIRAFVYDYHFTDASTRARTGCWWYRDNKREYVPAVMLQNGGLVLAH